MTDYIVLTERNEWEAETWRFYMPVEGNEGLLEILETAANPHYSVIIEKGITEGEIERRGGQATYMEPHNIIQEPINLIALQGTLDVYNANPNKQDPLYKGGLMRDLTKTA